jgi:tRNA(fMet)-specific endonuclease VapC
LILTDTDVLIEILDRNSDKGENALRKIEKTGEDVAITSINLHELLYGLYKYADQEKMGRVLLLDVIDFTKKDATLSARLELEMEKRGKKIARMDSMVAAATINRKLRFFTFNKRHFEGIEGLELI